MARNEATGTEGRGAPDRAGALRDTNGVTFRTALDEAAQRIDRLDARLLLQQVSGVSHAALIARDHETLDTEILTAYRRLVERCCTGEPLAYLTGSAGFYGLTLMVTPAVLIPRPETELLVDRALQHVERLFVEREKREKREEGQTPLRILDLGTGSGAIPVALAHALREKREKEEKRGIPYPYSYLCSCPAEVFALDYSTAALEVARANAQRYGLNIRFFESDWLSAVEAVCGPQKFDLILANPPYVAEGDPHLQLNGLPFEPARALSDGECGGNGLACIRRIVETAPDWLASGAALLIEHGYDQAAAVRELLTRAGLSRVESWRDLAGTERASGGVK